MPKFLLLNKYHHDESYKYEIYFYTFIIFHIFIWTILPAITRSNMHLDTLEAIIWGQEWQFGYQKHPPLSAWVAQIIVTIFKKKFWAGYLLSQLCIAAGMISIWRLAKIFLPLKEALMAVLILEGVYYYNFTSTEFNTNVLMMALWSWSIFYAWKAASENKPCEWLMLGLFLGLGMINKYYIIMLGAAIFLMMIYVKEFRQNFKTPNPYWFIVSFLAVTIPHLIWLVINDFPTIKYLTSRTATPYYFYNHLLIPLSFSGAQILSMLFTLVIFFITFPEIIKNKLKIKSASDNQKAFLIFMFSGPFLLSILPSILTASRMKDMWGMPLWGLCGIMLFYFFNPKLSKQKTKRFIISWLAIVFISITAYLVSNLIAMVKIEKRNSFNGELASKEVTKIWHEYQKNKLPIIVGDIWLGSNISFYSNENPRVFIDMNTDTSPWLSYKDLENKGGVIVWNIKEEGEDLPERYKNKINSLIDIKEPLLISSTAKKYKNQEPFKLGVAVIIPPETKNCNEW